MDRVLEILQSDPDYGYFTLDGQAIILEDYLEVRPEREPALRALVQAGRLLIGPWYVLPDEFLVSGEALVRNLILGHRMCARFGPPMKVGYTPDPFGHISQLPQILQGVGIDNAVFRRGLSEEPALLWWEAPDGSRVLVVYLREGYGNLAHPPDDVGGFCHMVQRQVELLGPHSPVRHLLLMNGTDHMFPQAYLPRLLREAAGRLAPVRLQHGHLPGFIAAVRAEVGSNALQVVRGELRSPRRHHLLPGVLSARMWIKQRNSASQTLLERHAEPLAALAGYLGGIDWRGHLRAAWRLLLQNHPHDSICGCSVDQVHAEMRPRFDGCDQLAEAVARQGLDFLARQIDTRPQVQTWEVRDATILAMHTHPDALAVVVFNPTPGDVSGLVSLEVPALPAGFDYRLRDASGQPIAFRREQQPNTLLQEQSVSGAELASLLAELEKGEWLGRALQNAHFRPPAGAAGAELTVWLTGAGSPDATALYRWLDRLRTHLMAAPVPACQVHAHLVSPALLTFVAPQVPGLGYRTFWLETVRAPLPGSTRERTSPESTFPEAGNSGEGPGHPDLHVENEFLRVMAEADGTFTLYDRRTGALWRGLNRFVDDGDAGDEYNHCPPPDDVLVESPAEPPSIRRRDAGALGQALEVRQIYRLPASLTPDRRGRSRESVEVVITSCAWLRPGVPRLDFETRLDNRAEDHRLRVLFPSGVRSDHVRAEGQFDLVRRGLGTDIEPAPTDTSAWVEQPVATRPQQTFVAVQEGGGPGLALANRGLPEYEARDGAGEVILALTLLRCVGWLSRDDFSCRVGQAGPQMFTPGAQCLGPATFHYSLIPFVELSAAARQAHAFNAGLRAAVVPAGSGVLPASERLIGIEPAALYLTALKPAEDGRGIVLRFFNSLDQSVEGRISLGLPAAEVWRVNLLEEDQERLALAGDRTLTLRVRGKEIVSLRLV